jgi:hypothetical protein
MKSKLLLAVSLCLTLIVTNLHPALSTVSAAPASPDWTTAIYDDALAPGWDNWSWGASLNFAATSPVHNGSKSIAVTLDGWGALSLAYPGGADTTGTDQLEFFLHGGSSGGQKLTVWFDLTLSGQTQQGPQISVPAPSANAWEDVQIPLTSLNPAGGTITRINWQSTSGSTQPQFFMDDIRFMSPTSPDAPSLSHASLTPRSIPADGQTELAVRVQVSDPQGLGDISAVTLDASSLGRGIVTLIDDGGHHDAQAGDGIYGAVLTVAQSSPTGERNLGLTAADREGHQSTLPVGTVTILGAAGGAVPASLPQQFGWGSNAWDPDPAQDWQVTSGVPWDYVYQYVTNGWETWGENFVSSFVTHAWTNHYVPIVTVYMVLGTISGGEENSVHYAQKMQDAAAVKAYLDSLRRAAQQANGTKPVIFNIEPDFYGYMQQLSNNTVNRPAGVQQNDPASYPVALNISGYPNNLAGFGSYVVELIHTTAPNALVAPMASMWATNADPQSVTDSQAIQMGKDTAKFIDAMGGDKADLLIVEWSDRDAGRNIRPWWDDQDLKLPRPTRAVLWENALSRQAGKRLLLWQIPVGNMSLDNTCHHYQDNRAAYAFSHPRDLFDAGIIGLVFGGGDDCSTNVGTDGGFVSAQGAIAYAAPAAPTGLTAGAVAGSLVPLRWNENNEPDLWGYQVVYSPLLGGQTHVVDARRANAIPLLLPTIGTWTIQVRAYDAQGHTSALSSTVSADITINAKQVFLSTIRH